MEEDLKAFFAATERAAGGAEESDAAPGQGSKKQVSVEEFKQQGNAAFKQGNNKEAIDRYSDGLLLDPGNHVLYSNRSAAYLKMGVPQRALSDADEVVRLKPDWGKGHGRRGAALFACGRCVLAPPHPAA